MELFPLITPAKWPNRDQCAHRLLVPHAQKSSPLLVFGMMEDGRPKYLSNKGMRKHRLQMASMELESLDRLRFRKERAGWVPRAETGDPPTIFEKIGDCLTASEIADQRTMKDMQALMGVDKLYVAIPTQECLIAGKDRAKIEKLARKRHATAEKLGETPLVPEIYELLDGQIVKVLNASTSKSRTSTRLKAGRTTSGSQKRLATSTTSGRRTGSSKRGTKSVSIPKTPTGTFVGIPASRRRGSTSAQQRELLRLPPKLWQALMALHLFAGAYLAASLFGLVSLVTGALQEEGGIKAAMLLSFAVIPVFWVMAWANYMTIRALKRGSQKAYRFAMALIGLWAVLPFLTFPQLGAFALLVVLVALVLVVIGFIGLLDPNTKKFCHVGEWEEA